MYFIDIPGQKNIKAHLRASISGGRIPHAQLFAGMTGYGSLALAIAYVRYINCENRGSEDSCGTCPACKKMDRLAHPDVHFSFPFVTHPSKTADKTYSSVYLNEWREMLSQDPFPDLNEWLAKINADNKQANINIAECHDILRQLNLKSFESGYKALIMWLPEYLGREGNVLLKLIEEPPEKTVIILVSEEPNSILNTILSRTQMLKILRLSDEELINYLMEQFEVERDIANKVALIADGDLRAAKALLANVETDNEEILTNWWHICARQWKPGMGEDMKELQNLGSRFFTLGREKQKHLLNYALHIIREMIPLKAANEDLPHRLLQDELKLAKSIAAKLNLEGLEEFYRVFDQAAYAIQRNANPKITFMDLSIKINHILTGRAKEPISKEYLITI